MQLPIKLILEKVLDKYRPGWRERSSRRKSFWHVPRVLISFVLLGVLWYALFKGMWGIHLYVYPSHAGHINEFWQNGISLKSSISKFLMAMPLFFPAMGLSFVLVNAFFWFIPPAKKAFEREADGDKEMTFAGATSGLIKALFKYLLPIGIGLSMLGAFTLTHL